VGANLSLGNGEAAGLTGQRAYAIGDIHGRLDLIEDILEKIAADNAARAPARTTIVFLGDLIDRGSQSAGVIELLRNYRPPFAETIFVMGNHEEVLLRVLAGETELLPHWLSFGGAESVRSYGIDPADLQPRSGGAALKLLRAAIPHEHLEFIQSFRDSYSLGPYLFVHGGIRPGVPLAEQDPEDLRWIRSSFLDDETDHGVIVVHGHTISEQVQVRPNRIGIDTGAFWTGVLTALGLEGDDRWLLQTAPTESLLRGT
jgi:serine/threonine protein phosphatase 1